MPTTQEYLLWEGHVQFQSLPFKGGRELERAPRKGHEKWFMGCGRQGLEGKTAMTVWSGEHELVNKLIILEQRGRSLNKEIRKKIKLPWGDSVIAHVTESMND